MLDYQLLSPDENVDEIFPFRRVWRVLVQEMALLFLVCGGIFFAAGFGFLEDGFSLIPKAALCLLPLLIFVQFSVGREREVIQPREGLLRLIIISVIVTNGVTVPIINLLITPDEWLTPGDFFGRLIGYTLTMGILFAFLSYAMLRYTIWPDQFRTRMDGIAYSVPIGLGTATVLSLEFVLTESPMIDAVAVRVLVNAYLHIVISAVMGYFLAEMAIGNVQAFWLSLGLFITAGLGGLFFAFRRIAIVSGLGSRSIGALALVVGFAALVLFALSFIIENAEQRMSARQGIRRIR